MEREVGEKYLLYHGLPVPKETHSPESLKFAQDFTFVCALGCASVSDTQHQWG
uniref:Uncharacterized protein n=1 Tax=Echeneis naucrates TaxID=173247 RepID=A0A665TCH3_ECHNA